MRYLRKQVLNRRAPFDDRLAVDSTNGVVMNTPNNLRLPKGTGDINFSVGTLENQRPVVPVTGMIRYNTDTDEVEVFQGIGGGATWRSLKFKESTGIIQQDLGVGDYIETYFGPLDPPPASVVDSNIEWASYGNLLTPGNTWTGANLIVIVENVIQLFNTNYTIVENPIGNSSSTGPWAGAPYPSGFYISFGSPVPADKPVTVLHGFDR